LNTARTFLLMLTLTVLFVLVGGYFAGRQGAIVALVIAATLNFIMYWTGDKLVLKRYRAHEVGPGDKPRLYNMVTRLSQQAGLPMPRVFVIPDRSPNAFATGRDPKHAAVAATQGILELLNDDELEGVMAHELAHVKHRDILTGTIAATMAGAIAVIAQMARFSSYNRNRQGGNAGLLLVAIGAPFAAMLIRMAISRVREYSADRGGSEISHKPLALASALGKLQRGVKQAPLAHGNPAHSHMFIVNPFVGGLQKLFSTHPPMEERVRRLQEIARESGMA